MLQPYFKLELQELYLADPTYVGHVPQRTFICQYVYCILVGMERILARRRGAVSMRREIEEASAI